MQPLPSPRIPSEQLMALAMSDVQELYLFARMSVDQTAVAGYGNGLLDSIYSTVVEYRSGSHYGEMEFMRPAWDYLHELISKLRVAAREDSTIKHDGCLIEVVPPKFIAELNWTTVRTELQQILTAIDADLYRAANPEYTKQEALVVLALHPRLVLK